MDTYSTRECHKLLPSIPESKHLCIATEGIRLANAPIVAKLSLQDTEAVSANIPVHFV